LAEAFLVCRGAAARMRQQCMQRNYLLLDPSASQLDRTYFFGVVIARLFAE
jgi:hypothetical protein